MTEDEMVGWHHQLPEHAQTHVHRVSDAIQPSHPLSSTSPVFSNESVQRELIRDVHSVTEHTSQIVQAKHIYGPKHWYFPALCQGTLVHHKDLTCHNMLSFPHCPGSDSPPYWIPISLASDCMPHLPLSIDPCSTTCASIAEVSHMRVLFTSTLTSSRYVIYLYNQITLQYSKD